MCWGGMGEGQWAGFEEGRGLGGTTKQDGHRYKTKSFFPSIFILFFCPFDRPIRAWQRQRAEWEGREESGRGEGEEGIFFSFFL